MSREFFVSHESGIMALVTAESIEEVRKKLPDCFASDQLPDHLDELARLTLNHTTLEDPVLISICQDSIS